MENINIEFNFSSFKVLFFKYFCYDADEARLPELNLAEDVISSKNKS